MTVVRRVLLVDDNRIFLRHATRFLSRQQDVVVEAVATTPSEALTAARKHRPDVIVTDISMPEMDGITLLPRLRDALPAARLVVLTMHDEQDYRRAALEAGANAFVRKTDLVDRLLPAIRGNGREEDRIGP